VGTLPPTSGPPVITVLPGANTPAASASPLVGQTIPSGGPMTVAGLRLAEVDTTVVATNMATGKQAWSFRDSQEPDLLQFVVGGGVVAIGVGHEVGTYMLYVATEHLDVVDLATGTPLWRSTVPGDAQSPAMTAMPGLVAFETLGHVVAVHARTGVLAWNISSPAGCADDAAPGPGGGISLASDPARLAATLPCGGSVVTQRINPATGAVMWTTPPYPGGQTNLLAVPVNTAVVVIPEMGNGSYLEGPLRAWIPPGVTQAISGGAIYTVLDDSTGKPLWTEIGAPIYGTGAFGNNDGTVCFIGAHTYECRTTTTGTLVRHGGPAY
jgi:outer membrane protein assembly factor BamB